MKLLDFTHDLLLNFMRSPFMIFLENMNELHASGSLKRVTRMQTKKKGSRNKNDWLRVFLQYYIAKRDINKKCTENKTNDN